MFVSPPQNAKKEGMGADLMESNADFRSVVNRAAAKLTENKLLDPKLGYSPVIFAIAAHSALVRATGIHPEVLGGFSVGENASLVQGGAIELDAMMQVLVEREKITGQGRAGAEKRKMIFFRGISLEGNGPEALRSFIEQDPYLKGLELTNIIGSSEGVLSGEVEDHRIAIQKLRELSGGELSGGEGVTAAKLEMPDAFHSSWMREQEIALKAELDRLNIRKQVRSPQVGRIYSPMLQRWLNTEDGVYLAIAEQLTSPVDIRRFCEKIRHNKIVISADPTGMTSRMLEGNGVSNVFNIHDATSFESVAEMLRNAA